MSMIKPIKRYIDLVYGAALRKPDAPAVICGPDRLTFKAVHERAGSLGAAFRAQGLKAGDRIAFLADNELEYIELQAACLRSGFTLVPLNSRLADPELQYIIKDCTPGMLIGGRNYADTVKRIGEQCGVARVISTAENGVVGSYSALLASAAPGPEADPADNGLNALILYTSGTTGHPKGATIDRMAFSARVTGNALEMEIGPDEVLLQNLPLFHISAFLFCAYFFRGATCILLPKFDPESALDIMQKKAVTATNGVPTIIGMLLDSPNIDAYDPAHLKLITYGGAPIEPALLKKAIAKFACGFQQHYGMTEAGSTCILKAPDHNPDDIEALTSAGCDAAGYELRIVDDEGRQLPAGQAGEIILRGAGLMTGYWGLPEKTAESLVDGWFHTGDVGYRDKRNFLHVIDRRNDMIISGGENIYPREIEAALAEHPAMPDAAIIGLPDPKWGEVVSCVLKEDAPSEEELETWLRGRLAGYKIPRRWLRVPELPRNAVGKVLKVQLRKQFGELDQGIRNMTQIIVSEVFNAPTDRLWRLIRDFGNVAAWWLKDGPIKIERVVQEGQGVGMIRHLYYVGVPTPLSERLEALDDDSKTYRLSIVGEGLPGLVSYSGKGVVTEMGPDRCRLDYKAEIQAAPEKEAAVEKVLRFGLSQVVAGLKAATEG